ncbi:MAG: hypothetical protein WAV79_00245, partial [Anaerolineae bacterium]
MWRTTVNPTADYWARWMPTIPQQGIYEVWVHVPNANATTWQARYTIAHYDGQSTAVVDQAGLNNQWVSIGVYRFHGGNADNVYLTDLTGEGYRVHCYDAVGSALGQNYCQIGVDAVKFVRRAITYLPDVRNASGGWNSTILVRNNGGNAFVDVKFYDPFDGFLATQTNSNLAGQGVWEVPVGLSGFSGAVVVDASQDQAMIVENRYSGSDYGDGNAAVAYSAFDAGSATMYLPYAVYYPDAVTGGVPFVQYSRFTVQNTTTAAASLQLTYINRGGVTDFTRTDTLLANGLRNYDLRYPGGAVPDLRQTGYYTTQCDNILVGCNWTGANKITSTNGQLITSVLTNYWRWYVAAYNGVSGGAQPVFAPSIERRCTDCNPNAGSWQGFSITIVQNLGNSNANVTLRYRNAATGNEDLTISNQTITPNAAKGFNTRSGGNVGATVYNVLGGAWAGAVMVESSQPLAVAQITLRPDNNVAGAYTGVHSGLASTNTYLPAVHQQNTAYTSCPPNENQWDQYSILRIQNPTTSNATDVDI